MDIAKLYYSNRDGSILLNKEKVWASIDAYDTTTVIPWCQIMDVPFLYDEWFKLVYRAEVKNQNPAQCIGKYFALMKLCSYKNLRFKDSDQLNSQIAQKKWRHYWYYESL